MSTDMQHIYDAIKHAEENGIEVTWPVLWFKHEQRWKCECEDKRPKFKITESGAKTFGFQCEKCGSWERKKREYFSFDIPTSPFSQEIRNRFRDARNAEGQNVIEIWQEIKTERLQNESARWRSDYEAYLSSDRWKMKRMAALERDRHICQGCLIKPATEVHHLSYKNIGNELLFELVSLCHDCHRRIHGPDVSGVDLSRFTQ
jgi:5-methylcytosine-specific restriction endonuclease McrA